MSAELLKKYVMITEGADYYNNSSFSASEQLPSLPDEINIDESTDFRGSMNLLDELEEAIQQAVDIARMLERDETLGGVVRSYTRPWLQAWITDINQPGSVESMRQSLQDRLEDEEYQNDHDDDDNAEGIMRSASRD